MLIILSSQDVETKRETVGREEREIQKKSRCRVQKLPFVLPTQKWVGVCTYLCAPPREVRAVHEVLVAHTLFGPGIYVSGLITK